MKKLYILLYAILISSVFFGQNIAINGGFEDWLAGSLDGGWTTVDFSTTDLTQNANSTYITEGSSSASIFLQTPTQADTDMLQSVSMTAGITYTISVDVYATDNQARARLFGPGYSPSVYSDDTVLNTWQTITIDYTPSISGTAVIGMRFYDTAANWTGSGSQFYIDNFQILNPSTDPSLALSDGPANGSNSVGDPETVNNATIDFATTNFTMSADAGGGTGSGGDGFIKWYVENTNGNVFVDGGNIFTSNDPGTTYSVNGLVAGETYFFRAELVDNNGDPLGSPVVYSFTMSIATYNEVATIASLRSSFIDPNTYYKVIGEVYNTYSRASNNQKYFQDISGGILVHDPNGNISTSYAEGDGVTNMRGHLELYNGLLELVPTEADWGKNSTGNTITPQVVTLADVQSSLGSYESKLVRINGVTFADGNGANLFTSSVNYVIDDGTASTFRTTFSEADYIGQTIPTGSTDIAVLVGNFNGSEQFTARSMSELTLATKSFDVDSFKVYPNPTSYGYINISSKSQTELNIGVYDILGKQVINTTVNNNRLDVSTLTSGIYVMRISQDNATTTKKLVIK